MNDPKDIASGLEAATTTVLAEISRTDAKSAVLLTAFSLPLAVLVASIPGHPVTGLAAALIAAGAVGLIIAMLLVLVVVRPSLGGAVPGTYLYWATATPEEVIQDLQKPTHRVEHIVQLSSIAKRKYRGLQVAIDVTRTSLVLLGLALLTTLW
ncbi:DUF5706 domain-containing protein (plasmid) [Streptomyces sp. NBC_00536]|uniref:Pycsar system effector family protein n=1 Tax=Streptomyces sp. NBC_00536 TaxID=2975769 RepID=UPI002E815200|nr:Pycsar system effector family protein [Streptomyces sp. NBC_00536]WUC84490.1 DUF5706 domain-containing protein [Streptomyces sp. NBC_00536]